LRPFPVHRSSSGDHPDGGVKQDCHSGEAEREPTDQRPPGHRSTRRRTCQAINSALAKANRATKMIVRKQSRGDGTQDNR
jgi:hypothetical protein